MQTKQPRIQCHKQMIQVTHVAHIFSVACLPMQQKESQKMWRMQCNHLRHHVWRVVCCSNWISHLLSHLGQHSGDRHVDRIRLGIHKELNPHHSSPEFPSRNPLKDPSRSKAIEIKKSSSSSRKSSNSTGFLHSDWSQNDKKSIKKRSPPPKGYEWYPPQHNQGFQSKNAAMTFSKVANASPEK